MNSSINTHKLSQAAPDTQAVLPDSPFRGIEPFRFIDSQVFFARKQETQKLLRYITIYRGVLLYGESGTGKSSLINAGLVPVARDEGYGIERLRVQPRRGEEIIIEQIQKTDSDAHSYLPSIFAGDKDVSPRIVLSVDAFMRKLREASYDSYRILVFDQFEELITLFEEAPRREELGEALNVQGAILKALVDLLRDPSLPIKLIFSFREDYLAKLTTLFKLYPNLTDQYLRLMPVGTEKLPEIIHGAIEKFPAYYGKGFSKSLADRLASAIEERSESGAINLSEVQIACLKLWQSSDPERLFEEKGVQGLLEDSLNDSLNGLAPELRDPAVALLSRMVTASGARNVVSEEDLISRVNDEEEIAQDLLKRALEGLGKGTKLVRRELRRDVVYWEITSEFLVPWIRRKRIERLADIERRKHRAVQRRRAGYALAGFVLILAALAWWIDKTQKEKMHAENLLQERTAAVIKTEEVEKERRIAEEQRATAEMAKQQAFAQEVAAIEARAEAEVDKEAAEKAMAALTVEKGLTEKARQEASTYKSRADDLNRQLNVAEARIRELSKKDQSGPTDREQFLEAELNKARREVVSLTKQLNDLKRNDLKKEDVDSLREQLQTAKRREQILTVEINKLKASLRNCK
ncbi:MAG TPA: hypothetical protein VF131_02235 [Blastocatellia bacterium]|nr:hypothetical protein [Blastocatellia bacterium]